MEARREDSQRWGDDNALLNLRWDAHSDTFVDLMHHFREQGLYCDASLACTGGTVYPVHKVVLSVCSEFFASIFASASCHKPVVVLQDVAGEELEALLTYMYRGHVQLPRHTLHGFLKVAQSLRVKGLSPPPLMPLMLPHSDTQHTWGVTKAPDALTPSTVPHYPRLHPISFPPPPPRPAPPCHQHHPPPERGPESWGENGGPRNNTPLSHPPPERGPESRGENGAPRSSTPLSQSGRGQEGNMRGGEDPRPPRKRYSPLFSGSEQSVGTFQNLVASEEERGVKEELKEEMDSFDSPGRLMICEEEQESEEDEEEEQGEEGAWREEIPWKGEEKQEDRLTVEEVMKAEIEREEREERREEQRREAERKMTQLQQPTTPTVIIPNGFVSFTGPQLYLHQDPHPPQRPLHVPSTRPEQGVLQSRAPLLGKILFSPRQGKEEEMGRAASEERREEREMMQIHPPTTPTKITSNGINPFTTTPPLHPHHQNPHPQQQPFHVPTTSSEQVVESRDPLLGKIPANQKRRRRLRGPKSWEYLVRLLKDPSTNPVLIRWENKAEGIFRLVQPGVIAQRWGRRTGKHASECLSYDNFARGLRYHYTKGALEPVSERQLVYRLGPKALQALYDDKRYGMNGASNHTAPMPVMNHYHDD